MIERAQRSTVWSLFAARARIEPARIAIVDTVAPSGAANERSYGELADRAERLAAVLAARGVGSGDRVAVLSENRGELLELLLAAARLGAIVACQSWRLAAPELAHCIALVAPKLALVSPRHRALFDRANRHAPSANASAANTAAATAAAANTAATATAANTLAANTTAANTAAANASAANTAAANTRAANTATNAAATNASVANPAAANTRAANTATNAAATNASVANPAAANTASANAASSLPVLEFGAAYEAALANATPGPAPDVDPEAALVILYTSGTTGLPKGAVISHRAQIVRNLVTRAEFAVAPDDAFVAWSPLYHMGAVDNSLGTLMTGGTVIVVDGFDVERLCAIVEQRPLGWLLLMPGMVGRFAAALRERGLVAKSIRVCGVMADLVPPAEIAEVTTLLRAPYANTFGATETGCPPCSSSLIPIGVAPQKLSKRQSPFCEVRLVDANDNDVPDGSPGELAMRGPTLFSGYWAADAANAHDFRGGWFHMGDVFVRNADGSLDFVDRVKYLIKTGGENVYPAEIERVMMQDPRVTECAVVRAPDPRWGEVPVAFVARRDTSLDEQQLQALCRAQLAGYKQPKQIRFIAFEDFPRSASGKVMRHELEAKL